MSDNPRIRQALENAEANVELLATMSDKKLAEKLDTIHLQSQIAEKKQITTSIELLEIWRNQVIAARIYKAENEIPDQPSEIDLAIADIEVFVARTEKRKEVFDELVNNGNVRSKSTQEAENNDQLSLF